MRKPVAGGELRQEIGALQVDADDLVENFLSRLRDVGAKTRSDAGVVDQRIEMAVGGESLVENALTIGRDPDVSSHNREFLLRIAREILARFGGGFGGLPVVGIMNRHGEPGFGERLGHAAAQSPGGAGDEDDGGGR
jgi:hypothetical protein